MAMQCSSVPRIAALTFVLAFACLPAGTTQAAQYDAYIHCVQRERNVPTTGGKFETVVRVERYTACYLIHIQRPGGAEVPDTRVGRGLNGTFGREQPDATTLNCAQLDAKITQAGVLLAEMADDQARLNEAVAQMSAAAVEARDAAAELRRTEVTQRASCDARTRAASDERARLFAGCPRSPRAERAECEAEIRADNADLRAMEQAARSVCRSHSVAQGQANTADRVATEAAIQARALDTRRTRLVAERAKLQAWVRDMKREQRARCPAPTPPPTP